MNTNDSSFDGKMLEWLGWCILGALITVFTLGICLPWAFCMMYRWEINHTVISGKRLKFNGQGGSLFGNWILWWFLSIITLGLFALWIPVKLARWKAERTFFDDESLADIKNFTPTHKVKLLTDAKGLGLRKNKNPFENSFTQLSDGTEVQHLSTGNKIKMQDKEGLWYEVITKDGIRGWCFSGSLEKL